MPTNRFTVNYEQFLEWQQNHGEADKDSSLIEDSSETNRKKKKYILYFDKQSAAWFLVQNNDKKLAKLEPKYKHQLDEEDVKALIKNGVINPDYRFNGLSGGLTIGVISALWLSMVFIWGFGALFQYVWTFPVSTTAFASTTFLIGTTAGIVGLLATPLILAGAAFILYPLIEVFRIRATEGRWPISTELKKIFKEASLLALKIGLSALMWQLGSIVALALFGNILGIPGLLLTALIVSSFQAVTYGLIELIQKGVGLAYSEKPFTWKNFFKEAVIPAIKTTFVMFVVGFTFALVGFLSKILITSSQAWKFSADISYHPPSNWVYSNPLYRFIDAQIQLYNSTPALAPWFLSQMMNSPLASIGQIVISGLTTFAEFTGLNWLLNRNKINGENREAAENAVQTQKETFEDKTQAKFSSNILAQLSMNKIDPQNKTNMIEATTTLQSSLKTSDGSSSGYDKIKVKELAERLLKYGLFCEGIPSNDESIENNISLEDNDNEPVKITAMTQKILSVLPPLTNTRS